MKKKFIAAFAFLFLTIVTYGQDNKKHEADSLLELVHKSKPDIGRINLLLKLAEFQVFKPGENKADLDSASEFISQAKVINNNIRSKEADGYITLTEAFLTKERGQRTTGKELAAKAIEMLKNGKDKLNLGRAYFELQDYYNYDDSLQLLEKIRLVELAVLQFQQSGNKEREGYGLKFLGDLYQINEDYPKALHSLDLSLQTYRSIHYTQLQGVYVLYGEIYYMLANYKQALNYDLMALKAAESAGDTSMSLCQICTTISHVLIMLGERENALSYSKQALKIAEKHNDNVSMMIIINNITANYISQNRSLEALNFLHGIPKTFLMSKDNLGSPLIPQAYLNIYTNLKKYRQAQVYCDRILGIIKLLESKHNNLNNLYNSMIKFFIASSQYHSAQLFLQKKELLNKKTYTLSSAGENLSFRFRLDSATGNYKSAFYNLLQYKNIKDSIFNETKSKQIKQLEVEYETDKKTDSIKLKEKDILVLRQTNQLQQNKLNQAAFLRNVIIGGIILSLVITGLVFRQYRQKQQNNKVITTKNEMLQHLLVEKEWLLKEVHHRVKNNLHTVISLLESQAAYLENDALKAIENSQHRIYAMSLIHQKLYQSDDVKTIDMSVYLPEFVRYLDESFDAHRLIRFQLEVEALNLGVSQAIPIALIINEAVTNSIKYAFPQNRKGIIEISMHKVADQITLVIADNGIGIDEALANAPSESLGLKLIKGLSADIDADIHIKNDHGTKITILFNVDSFYDTNQILEMTDQEIYA